AGSTVKSTCVAVVGRTRARSSGSRDTPAAESVAALTAATLLAWLKLLALDSSLARAEPKTLRYRILHAAARLTRGGRQRRLNIQATWPWAADIVTAWDRVSALPQAP